MTKSRPWCSGTLVPRMMRMMRMMKARMMRMMRMMKAGFLGGADGAVGSADAPIGNCTRVVLVLILLVLVGKAAAAILAPAPALEGYQFGREATACADGTVPLQPDQCEGAAAELGYAWGGKIVDSQAPDGCYVQWSPSHPRGAFYWTSTTNHNKMPDTRLICGKGKKPTSLRKGPTAR
mmetsp:Transcript_33496/g.85683  ORF Transcript_33496/g.85683 Transcript_33496/m.85683 type:complete len:179 (+) Transcript_33496:184-720(+)